MLSELAQLRVTHLSYDELHVLFSALLIFVVVLLIRRLLLSPLRSIPGPIHWRLSRLPGLYASWAGHEASLYTAQFTALNTPILRIGPNEVLIADGSALHPIYVAGGGMPKAPCYANFAIDGFDTLFSARDTAHRSPCARAVVGMFATRSIREHEEDLRVAVNAGVERFKRERQIALDEGSVMNLQPVCRVIAIDVVTGYLFGTAYEGAKETSAELSASPFVDAFVAVGRFFYLSPWLFGLVDRFCQWAFETPETSESMSRVDLFVKNLVQSSKPEDKSYQARLLELGLPEDEVVAQCKDLIFAGTDSSGMNLSTFCWHMAREPNMYDRLREELKAAREADPDCDVATLPFLRACIRETLRVAMANPSRMPRVVPPEGWTFKPDPNFSFSATHTRSPYAQKEYFLPAGTLVSIQTRTLHLNPHVYMNPDEFNPDRWLGASEDQLETMNRDWMPFSTGSRQCIARNLAMMELTLACAAIIEAGCLDGASSIGERIEIFEWFNSRVKGEQAAVESRKL